MGVMHQENSAASQFESCILAVKGNPIAGFVGNMRHHIQVTGIVTVDDVHRQAKWFQHTQGARRHHVTTVQHGFSTLLFGSTHRRLKQGAVIVTVGHDANFHNGTLSLASAEDSRHKIVGPSAAWTRPSSVQGCMHSVSHRLMPIVFSTA